MSDRDKMIKELEHENTYQYNEIRMRGVRLEEYRNKIEELETELNIAQTPNILQIRRINELEGELDKYKLKSDCETCKYLSVSMHQDPCMYCEDNCCYEPEEQPTETEPEPGEVLEHIKPDEVACRS